MHDCAEIFNYIFLYSNFSLLNHYKLKGKENEYDPLSFPCFKQSSYHF